MKKLLALLFLISLLSESVAQTNYSFLFDNSGSMLGYYGDKKSTFKMFAKALIKNSIGEKDNVSVYLFSKNDTKRGIQSPVELYKGLSKDLLIDKVIGDFKSSKGKDNDYGSTDIIEAIDKAIEGMKTGTGIIWLITDNINDNSGSGDSSFFNTLEFYKRLRNDDKIKKILLFPIPEKISGEKYESTGYVCYAIYYSDKEVSQQDLEKIHNQFLGIGIKQKPITLKPLDIGTITLHPKLTQSKISEGKLYFDGKALRGFGFEEGENIREVFPDLVLKSNLFPYIIKSAKLSVRLDKFSSSDYSVKSLGTQSISPSTVSNVSPEGEVTGFSVTFNMPEITPVFSFNTIFKEDFSVGGSLVLEVSQVDILLDEPYMNNFKELFALNSIPEIFKPVLKDKKIETRIPLEIRIKYGAWRLFLLISIIIIILLIIFAIAFLLFRKKSFEITVNNSDIVLFSISAISSYNFSAGYSPVLGKITISLFGKLKFKFSSHTNSQGKTISITEGIPFDVDYFDEREESVTLNIISTVKGKASLNSSKGNAGETSKYH